MPPTVLSSPTNAAARLRTRNGAMTRLLLLARGGEGSVPEAAARAALREQPCLDRERFATHAVVSSPTWWTTPLASNRRLATGRC